MKTSIQIITVLVLNWSLLGCNAQKSNLQEEMKKDVISQNFYEYTGMQKAQSHLIKDQENWEKWHQELFKNIEPLPEIESIDFSQYSMVIFAFGERSSGGFFCEADSYIQKNNVLIFNLIRPKRDPLDPVTMAFTQPVLVCKIPVTTASKLNYTLETQ